MPQRRSDIPSPKQLLDARHLVPRKRFGQNFLSDARVAQRIAEALPLNAYVIEIGAGTGTLTEPLLRQSRSLTAFEIDRDLCRILEERFLPAHDRLNLVCGDFLAFDLAADLHAQSAPRAIAGNLPYYITTPIIETIFAAGDLWESAVIMVQKEYARRLGARPGTAAYGSLSVFAAYFCSVQHLFDVGAAGFYPAPQVASAVVRLTPRRERRRMVADEPLLLWLIRAAFSHRRKTFVNSVLAQLRGADARTRKGLESALRAGGFDTAIRGEKLNLADFCILADTLSTQGIFDREWIAQSNT
jgi:16S rRNA (adenine1518-N6/adenine1519-N6)-dimethyltransferase